MHFRDIALVCLAPLLLAKPLFHPAPRSGSLLALDYACSTNAECLQRGLRIRSQRTPAQVAEQRTKRATAVPSTSFTTTGANDFDITTPGLYMFTLVGGSGGNSPGFGKGGAGAKIVYNLTITAAVDLTVFVGGKGIAGKSVENGGGGGGGTFIYETVSLGGLALPTPELYFAAGGGGGRGFNAGGDSGQTSTTATAGHGGANDPAAPTSNNAGGAAGTNELGGQGADSTPGGGGGGGGAGFLGPGTAGFAAPAGTNTGYGMAGGGGQSLAGGFAGGSGTSETANDGGGAGGIGGGGGAGDEGGGGGGGYNGGGGGSGGAIVGGGGGSSFAMSGAILVSVGTGATADGHAMIQGPF